jgi:hypothetical protein
MSLYTGVQLGWPKKLLMSPGAGEQKTVVCCGAGSVFRPRSVQAGVNHHLAGSAAWLQRPFKSCPHQIVVRESARWMAFCAALVPITALRVENVDLAFTRAFKSSLSESKTAEIGPSRAV